MTLQVGQTECERFAEWISRNWSSPSQAKTIAGGISFEVKSVIDVRLSFVLGERENGCIYHSNIHLWIGNVRHQQCVDWCPWKTACIIYKYNFSSLTLSPILHSCWVLQFGIHLLTAWSGIPHWNNHPALWMSVLNHDIENLTVYCSEKFRTQGGFAEVNHIVL